MKKSVKFNKKSYDFYIILYIILIKNLKKFKVSGASPRTPIYCYTLSVFSTSTTTTPS